MSILEEYPGAGDLVDMEVLRNSLVVLRRRMLLLARLLPLDLLRLLDDDLDELESEVFGADLLAGLSDSTSLIASDVETALREVWARTQA